MTISSDRHSFYFDVHEKYLTEILPLFDEEGKFKYGFGRRLDATMKEIKEQSEMV